MRAGTPTMVRRMVAVRALPRAGPVMLAAARVRLKAMTARTSQAALAAKCPGLLTWLSNWRAVAGGI